MKQQLASRSCLPDGRPPRHTTGWPWPLALLPALCLILLLAGAAPAARADPEPETAAPEEVGTPCNVSGLILSDTVWDPTTCNPYIVTGNVSVQGGATLTIAPDTTIKFNPTYALAVQGTLIARGTAASPITFTSNQATPAKGDWGYIHFAAPSTDATFDADGNYTGGCILQYAIIEYAGGASVAENGALRIEGSPYIDHNTIRNNKTDGVHVWNQGAPRITNNGISGNSGNGIYANSLDHLTISGNAISGSSGDGLHLYACNNATVSSNAISGNSGNGIEVSGNADIVSNTVSGNTGRGIHAIYGSSTIAGNTIVNNADGGISVFASFSNRVTTNGNTVTGNSTSSSGGGIAISISGGTVTIGGDTITGNSGAYGGGIYVSSYASSNIATISGSTITGNTASFSGGAIYVSSSTTTISGNTITNNTVRQANRGGGIGVSSGSTVTITDNNLYNNLTGYPGIISNDLYNGKAYGSGDVNAENNWWGTADPAVIEDHIWHFPDDPSLSVVDYVPFRTGLAPTLTPTPTVTPTGINSPTVTATATRTNTPTPSYTPSATPTWINTPTATWTNTSTPTWTNTPTATWTNTPTPTNTPTSTPTPTRTSRYLPLVLKYWPPLPPAPTLNSINNADGDGNYVVSWTAVARADTYTLQEAHDADFTDPVTVYQGPGTSWTASGKAPGTYYYRVNANNAWGDSPWSNVQSATVLPLPPPPTLNPINNADGDENYVVSWTVVAWANTYTLQEDDNANFSSPATVYGPGPGTSWSASGKTPGTYYYRAKASNVRGDSAWSNVQSATVLPLLPPPTLNPINNADGDENYVVSWTTVAGATTYTLQEDDNAGFSSPTTVYQGSGTSWSASGKAPGTYYYRAKASNVRGDSAWSNVQSVTVLPPPPDPPTLNPINNADGDGNYVVSWTAAARATAYTLQEDDNAGFTSPATVYNGSGTSWSAGGKAAGVYYYRVKASNARGDSAWSNVQSVTVRPALPTRLYATADAALIQGAAGVNFGSATDMWVGYEHCSGSANGITRSLVKFDLSAIPQGTQISRAWLWLDLENSCDSSSRNHNVVTYRVSSAWSEMSVTWNSQPGIQEAYGSSSVTSRSWGRYHWDVTNLVRGWINGSFLNYGLMLRGPESSGNDSARLGFATRESSGTTYDPYLEITYTGAAGAIEGENGSDKGISGPFACEPGIQEMLDPVSSAGCLYCTRRACPPD